MLKKAVLILSLPLIGLPALPSDEIPGSVADVISAIRERNLGKTFELTVDITSFPSGPGSYFAVEDATGALAIRRRTAWPDTMLTVGDRIKLICEILETPASPIGAYYKEISKISTGSAKKQHDKTGDELSAGEYDGRLVQLSGFISDIFPDQEHADWVWLVLSKGDARTYVLLASNRMTTTDPERLIGSEANVNGFCLKTRVGACLHGGRFILTDGEESIRISHRPNPSAPIWFFGTTGVLASALVIILIWNTILRKLIERRSQELTDETVARVMSDLKVSERTRLAVELHDSIAQNLTGVSMEIRTADRVADTDLSGMHGHLDLAVKTLDSCRKDLRNCLWDLRNLTLEEEDIADAIRRTLEPHIGDATLSVRFNVPRDRFTDNTAHTILRIIRELATNAIRHGKASAIKVAGSIDGDILHLSVKDNGCGFDPATAPGMVQGHFGLQGIRDRVDGLEGEMRIESTPGTGCKVTISLHTPSGRKSPVP